MIFRRPISWSLFTLSKSPAKLEIPSFKVFPVHYFFLIPFPFLYEQRQQSVQRGVRNPLPLTLLP